MQGLAAFPQALVHCNRLYCFLDIYHMREVAEKEEEEGVLVLLKSCLKQFHSLVVLELVVVDSLVHCLRKSKQVTHLMYKSTYSHFIFNMGYSKLSFKSHKNKFAPPPHLLVRDHR